MVKNSKFVILVFSLLFYMGNGRIVTTTYRYSTDIVSKAGMNESINEEPIFLSLDRLSSTVTCEPMYGFLPCTTSLWGNLFLVLLYEYLLFHGEKYISMGSDLLFKVLGPGVFGASAFHILGSLPEAILVLATGIYGSEATAQDQVTTGISILAGSTVILLTLLYGSCLAVGSFNLSTPSIPSNTKKFPLPSLTGFGVKIDVETSYTAVIMMISIIPFIVAHIPQILGISSGRHISILIALFISLGFLVIYCVYQVFQPWIQNRRLEYVLGKYMGNVILGKLLSDDGVPKVLVIKELFQKIDTNNDKYVTLQEIKGLILGIQFEEVGLKEEDFLGKIMEEFDTSRDTRIDENEFVGGISSWLSKTKHSVYKQDRKRRCQQNPQSKTSQTSNNQDEEQELLVKTKDEMKIDHREIHGIDNCIRKLVKATFFLVFGTSILGLLAAPLIDAVMNFSTAANISSFHASFIMLPVAINYREAASALRSMREKKEHFASLTFSEIYSAVFMNNIVGISIFLGIVYVRGLAWNFSAEVIVVQIVCIVMGLVGCFCRTLPLWTCLIAYLLYLFSLSSLYVFKTFFGWA